MVGPPSDELHCFVGNEASDTTPGRETTDPLPVGQRLLLSSGPARFRRCAPRASQIVSARQRLPSTQ